MEIELKFLLAEEHVETFKKTASSYNHQTKDLGSSVLSNAYYDTKSKTLRDWDIGLRTRTIEKSDEAARAEQTVKLAGTDLGGLQQRPEFNVDINLSSNSSAAFANLDLFEPTIWPNGFDVKTVNSNLVKVFETRFTRYKWIIELASGGLVECVLDQGIVEAEHDGQMQQQTICEFELELLKGDPSSLFELAYYFSQKVPAKLGYLSKAARGYHLAQGQIPKVKNLESVALKPGLSIEQAFIKSLSYGLSFVQHNELVFAQDHKSKSFRRVMDGVSLIIQTLTLFAPHLRNSSCNQFIKRFRTWRGQVSWLESFYQLDKLQDRKSPYRKDIESRAPIMALLASKKMPEDKLQSLADEFYTSQFNQLMLNFIHWLSRKGWRNEVTLTELKGLGQSIEYQAQNWLTKAWQDFKQGVETLDLNGDHKAIERNYWQLVAGMLTGLIVGQLYAEQEREQFRGQLLNLLLGFEEYILLLKLQHVISQEPEIEQESVKWISAKMGSLEIALSASVIAVKKLKPYW